MTNKLLNISRKKLILIFSFLSICTGCEKKDLYHHINKEFSLNIGFDTFDQSKSGNIPDNIADINLFVFEENGNLAKHVLLNNTSSTTLQISYGTKTIAAIANVGNHNFSHCTTLALLRASTHNAIIGTSGNMVFSGELTQAFSPSLKNVIIPLTRMLSKITYVFDKTDLDPGVNITITSIQLMNTPTVCTYFTPNTPHSSQIQYYGEALEGPNLEPFNHASAEPLYVFENMQGTIGTSNNPIEKHPGSKQNVCTYVEITADYSSLEKAGTIKYKNFLGSNTTNDYNLVRGNHYKETIVFNGTSINEVSWRVDVSNLRDIPPTNISVTGISLDSSSLKLITGDQHQLHVAVYPINATNRECTWDSSNPTVVSVNPATGELTTHRYGQSTITVRSCDGALEATCLVNVYDPITLYIDTHQSKQYNQETNEEISCEVILFLRANLSRPSNTTIMQGIEPFVNCNVSYSYTVKNTTFYGNGVLTLDKEHNNDNPHLGVRGEIVTITFIYPISEIELLAAIGSISFSLSPGSVYAQNWYVTW